MKGQNDFWTKLASFILVYTMLGNDIVASARAITSYNFNESVSNEHFIHSNTEFEGKFQNNYKSSSRNELSSTEAVGMRSKVVKNLKTQVKLRSNTTAYLGFHKLDPLHSPEDDFFEFELKDEIDAYPYAALEYEVQGLENGLTIVKSINGHNSYYEEGVAQGYETKKVEFEIDRNELVPGKNIVRFGLPQKLGYPVTISNVSLVFSKEPFAVDRSEKLVRTAASPEHIHLLSSEEENVKLWEVLDMDIPSVPTHIRNVTRGASAFLMEGSLKDSARISLKYRMDHVSPVTGVANLHLFYFDKKSKSWKDASGLSIDISEGTIEGSAPSNTNYFAGLISTPEMPEASAFVPTAISDIKAASPAAGMSLMQPPAASNTGEASINYPLAIPAGRNGMTPNLNLTYSSDAGTGILGVGWNISVSQIAIDTKWGVPKFPTDVEEEGYMLNGKVLIREGGTRPNRSATLPSRSSVSSQGDEARFFERTMHSYKEIKRGGGSTPDQYVWVETTADQTKYYYGTRDGSTLDNVGNSYLADNNGNIVRWYLSRIEDKWGNQINYTYQRVTDNDQREITGFGKQVLLKKIDYTGYNNTAGAYSVQFTYSAGRKDALISMNTGVKELNNHRLDKIEVYYNTTKTKEFQFGFVEGDFGKTLLQEVQEYRNGNFFYKHRFKYYEGDISYGPAQELQSSIPAIDAIFKLMPKEVERYAAAASSNIPRSAINTSSTWGWGGGGSIGLGVALGFLPFPNKALTFSGRLGYSETNDDRWIFIDDMNGDGLPDLVYDVSGIKYYPLKRDNSGLLSLENFKTIDFNKSLTSNKSTTLNYGFDFVAPMNIYQYGKNWAETSSKTSRYLTDYNADGIKDVVDGDAVKFGYLNPQGDLSFDKSSVNTPNPVLKGEAAMAPLPEPPKKDLEIVKIWTAPFTGTIDINGTALVTGPTEDGVSIGVQHNDDFLVNMISLSEGGQAMTASGVSVVKGDKILFRTQANSNGYFDFVYWDPEVSYQNLIREDASGLSYTSSNYTDGFLLSGASGVSVRKDQMIKVIWPAMTSASFTDELIFRINVLISTSPTSPPEYHSFQKILPAGVGIGGLSGSFVDTAETNNMGNAEFLDEFAAIPGLNVGDECYISFEVFSHSNVNWTEIDWRPEVQFGDDPCGLPKTSQYPTVLYNTYNKLVKMEEPYSPTPSGSSSDYVRIWPELDQGNSDLAFTSDELTAGIYKDAYFVVKTEDDLLAKMMVRLKGNGVIEYYKAPNSLSAALIPYNQTMPISDYDFARGNINNQSLHLGFFCKDKLLAEFLEDYVVSIGYYLDDGNTEEGATTNYSVFYSGNDGLQDFHLGWGQFCWTNTDNPISEIPIDQLHLDKSTAEDNDFSDGSTPSTAQMEAAMGDGSLNPIEQAFNVMIPMRGDEPGFLPAYINEDYAAAEVRKLDRWSAWRTHCGVYAQAGATTPGKYAEGFKINGDEDEDESGAYGANAIALETYSKTLAESDGVGLSIYGFGFSMGESNSVLDIYKYNSTTETSFMDINGDGYPDILRNKPSEKKIQITGPLGGLGIKEDFNTYAYDSNLGLFEENNHTETVSGSYANGDERFEKTENRSVGGSSSLGKNNTRGLWIDVNGDGLPDRFTYSSAPNVELNTGTSLSSAKPMNQAVSTSGYLPIRETKAESLNTGVGSTNSNLVNMDNPKSSLGGSFSGGIGVTKTSYNTQRTFADLNGDNLPEILVVNGTGVDVHINLGTKWEYYGNLSNMGIDQATAYGIYANIAGTLAFNVAPFGPFAHLKLSLNGNVQGNFALNQTNKVLRDMNGDGVPDIVESNSFGKVSVRYGQVGKSNLLKEVVNPLGGGFVVDYELVGSKYGYEPVQIKLPSTASTETMYWDMPFSKYVMSDLIINDGMELTASGGSVDLDGFDVLVYQFKYDGGYKSRRERDFHGFTRVETINRANIDIPVQGGEKKRFTSQITEYMRPLETTPVYLRRFEYLKGVSKYHYSLYHEHYYVEHQDGEDISYTYHEDMYIMSQTKNTYEPRSIVIDRGETNFGLVKLIKQDPEVVNWNNVSETQSIFLALTDKQEASFPEYKNQEQAHVLKYLLEYDQYMNVTKYSREGSDGAAEVQESVIGTITNTEYEYHVESYPYSDMENGISPFEDVTQDPNTGDNCFTISHPGYPDVYMCIPPYTFEQDDCTDPNQFPPGDPPSFEVEFRRLKTTITEIKEKTFTTPYLTPILAKMTYHTPGSADGRTNALKTHKIHLGSDQPQDIERSTETVLINSGVNDGKAPKQIFNYINSGGTLANVDLTYDQYGNVNSIQGPPNDANERVVNTFSYDGTLHQYLTAVNNTSYSESVCYKYDLATGNLLRQVDVNGHATAYTYDNMFRLKDVYGPREYATSNSAPTISFAYHPQGIDDASSDYRDTIAVAITTHNMGVSSTQAGPTEVSCASHDNFDSRPTISVGMRTATFVDGMQRVIQVKKESAIGVSGSNVLHHEVSGMSSYDFLGRVMNTSLSISEGTTEPLGRLNDSKSTTLVSKMEYDYANRPRKTSVIREGASSYQEIINSYRWTDGDDLTDDEPVFVKYTSNPVQTNEYINSEGFVIARVQGADSSSPAGAATIYTQFNQDALGQMKSVEDPLGLTTSYQYDWLGRMTKEIHPDRGTTDFTYDNAGNLIKKVTPNTGSAGITMTYNFNRLESRTVPVNPTTHNVSYIWGEAGDGKNGAGRIVAISQGSNYIEQEYKYDELGNRVYEYKSFNIPNAGFRSYEFNYKYDSWGRMHEMQFPDNEVVSYLYESSGEFKKMTSTTPYVSTLVIDKALYDGFGNLQQLVYGNGAKTDFTYNNFSRRLSNVSLEVNTPAGITEVLNKDYSYYGSGNVAGVVNHSGEYTTTGVNSVQLGGQYQFEYEYDAFNRLSKTVSPSNFRGGTYELTMGNEEETYNKAGGILEKEQVYPSGNSEHNYHFEYSYQSGTHRIHEIENHSTGDIYTYAYDLAGNTRSVARNSEPKPSEVYTWNELGYMVGATNSSGIAQYEYDHSGERVMKGTFRTVGGNIVGEGAQGAAEIVADQYTIYVNPYYVVSTYQNDEEGTKHYYMGSQRVASTQVSYFIDLEMFPPESYDASDPSTPGAIVSIRKVFEDLNEYLDAGIDVDFAVLLEPVSIEDAIPFDDYQMALDENACETIECRCAQSIYWTNNQGFNCIVTQVMYYYHPDYLGNTEFVTNAQGEPYQFFWYSPWGEPLEDQHSGSGSFSTRYKFNAKELDEETGNYYYGARYYNPRTSVWLSVDALASHPDQVDKSPYAFTWNNPVNLVDPDGNCPSCKTKEDWRIYQAQLDNYGLPIGAFGVDESGNRIAYLNGKVIDIVRHEGRMDAFFAITPVDALMPNLVGSFTKFVNAGKSFNKWLWGDDVAKTVDKIADASGGKVLRRGSTNSGEPRVVVQKGDRTFDITEARVKEYVKNPRNPNAQYGDQVDFSKAGVPEGSERIFGAGKGHKRTPTQAELDLLFGD